MCTNVFNTIAHLVKSQVRNMRKVTTEGEHLNPDCDSVPGRRWPTPERRWLTIEQIAARYQLSVRTIANMMDDGRLPFYKVGRAIRFDPVECDRAMRAFRRASKFDTFVQDAGNVDCDIVPADQDCTDQPSEQHKRRSRRTIRPKKTFAAELLIFALTCLFGLPRLASACPGTASQEDFPVVVPRVSSTQGSNQRGHRTPWPGGYGYHNN